MIRDAPPRAQATSLAEGYRREEMRFATLCASIAALVVLGCRAETPAVASVAELMQPMLLELDRCAAKMTKDGVPYPEPYLRAALDRVGNLTELEYGFERAELPPDCKARLDSLPRHEVREVGPPVSCTRVECYTAATAGRAYPCYAYTLSCP